MFPTAFCFPVVWIRRLLRRVLQNTQETESKVATLRQLGIPDCTALPWDWKEAPTSSLHKKLRTISALSTTKFILRFRKVWMPYGMLFTIWKPMMLPRFVPQLQCIYWPESLNLWG